jgi:hypothetical protein
MLDTQESKFIKSQELSGSNTEGAPSSEQPFFGSESVKQQDQTEQSFEVQTTEGEKLILTPKPAAPKEAPQDYRGVLSDTQEGETARNKFMEEALNSHEMPLDPETGQPMQATELLNFILHHSKEE